MVQALLDTRCRWGRLQYLVDWQGYDLEPGCWMCLTQLWSSSSIMATSPSRLLAPGVFSGVTTLIKTPPRLFHQKGNTYSAHYLIPFGLELEVLLSFMEHAEYFCFVSQLSLPCPACPAPVLPRSWSPWTLPLCLPPVQCVVRRTEIPCFQARIYSLCTTFGYQSFRHNEIFYFIFIYHSFLFFTDQFKCDSNFFLSLLLVQNSSPSLHYQHAALSNAKFYLQNGV